MFIPTSLAFVLHIRFDDHQSTARAVYSGWNACFNRITRSSSEGRWMSRKPNIGKVRQKPPKPDIQPHSGVYDEFEPDPV
jgi:hypothetical protein